MSWATSSILHAPCTLQCTVSSGTVTIQITSSAFGPKIAGDTAVPSTALLARTGYCRVILTASAPHESSHVGFPDRAWTRESLPAPPGRSEQSFLEASVLNHGGWRPPWAPVHGSLIMRWPDSKPQLPLEHRAMTSPSHSPHGPDPRSLPTVAEVRCGCTGASPT